MNSRFGPLKMYYLMIIVCLLTPVKVRQDSNLSNKGTTQMCLDCFPPECSNSWLNNRFLLWMFLLSFPSICFWLRQLRQYVQLRRDGFSPAESLKHSSRTQSERTSMSTVSSSTFLHPLSTSSGTGASSMPSLDHQIKNAKQWVLHIIFCRNICP